MSNEVVVQDDDEELIKALQSSVYVDASREGIKLVLSICRNLKLNPLSKPLHLVRMGDKEVTYNGIAMYRIMADRTGQFLGMSEALWGEIVTEMVGKTRMTFPISCTLVGKKQLSNGSVAEITHTELWKENYGTVSDKVSPNLMWYKRPYAQLHKCAEAQLLRRLFPDTLGGAPTYEEMHSDAKDEVLSAKELNPQLAVNNTTAAIKDKFKTTSEKSILDKETGESTDLNEKSKEELLDILRELVISADITKESLDHFKAQANVKSFTEMTLVQLIDLIILFNEEKEGSNG